MSVTPRAARLVGSGRLPSSGMPGYPIGPRLRTISTVSGLTSRWGSSEAVRYSSIESNTRAGPRWRNSAGVAADIFSTAPRGTRFPRSTTVREANCTGWAYVAMTSRFQVGAPA